MATLAAAIAPAVAVAAAKAPPLPQGAGHTKVTVVARGVPTPTAFAFFAGRLFVAGYGDENDPSVAGGVYLLRGGKAIRVPGSPMHVFGLAATKTTLYLSSRSDLLAWSGWDGTRFRSTRVIRTRAPVGGFRGLAVGPDGLIYVGADTTPVPPPPAFASVLSVDPATGSATAIAGGMRQPWQLLFLPGHDLPLVTDLNQDDLGPNRPLDYLIAIKRGANYGFPACPANPRTCANYSQPLVKLPAHSSPMGLAYLERQGLRRAVRRPRSRPRRRLDATGRRSADTLRLRVPGRRDRTRQCRGQPVCRRSERRDLPRHALTLTRTFRPARRGLNRRRRSSRAWAGCPARSFPS